MSEQKPLSWLTVHIMATGCLQRALFLILFTLPEIDEFTVIWASLDSSLGLYVYGGL